MNLIPSPNPSDRCVLGFTIAGFGELLRTLGFSVVLHLCTKKCWAFFPLPFTWIFKDFSKFIFEPICVEVFKNYLEEKEPQSNQKIILETHAFELIMKMYVSDYTIQNGSETHTENFLVVNGGESQNTRRKFLECVNSLLPSFENFQKTYAFNALFNKVKEFQEIGEGIYD